MNKILYIIILPLILLLVTLTSGIVRAQEQQDWGKPDTIVLPQNEVVNRDYFAAGESVILSGIVNGDAYVAGGNVIIEGTVNGDLLVAGGNLTINGTVSQDVRLAGGNVSISGNVGRNITVLGGNANISDTSQIGGSVTAAGGNVELYAPINSSVNVAGGQVTIANTIAGDLTAAAGQLTLTPEAQVNGNLTYWSESEANVLPGATITGQVTRQPIPEHITGRANVEDVAKVISGVAIFFKIANLLSRIILGLLLLTLVPLFVRKVVDTIDNNVGMSILFGLLAVVLIPSIIFLLLVTVIGIPLAIMVSVIFFIIWYVAPIFVAIWAGNKLFQRIDGLAMIGGLVIYELLSFIPFVGWLVMLIAVFLGIGALFITWRTVFSELRTKKVI